MNVFRKPISVLSKCASAIVHGLYMWVWLRPQQLVELIFRPEFYTSPTYYPEHPERLRSHWSQFWNQVGEIMRFGRINTLYFLCGYDVKTREEQKEYVHYNTFMRRRIELNAASGISCASILRDKLVFAVYSDGLGLNNANNLFFTVEGVLYDFASKKSVGYGAISGLGNKRLFCKPLDGQCGRGIFVMEVEDGKVMIEGEVKDEEALRSLFAKGRYLVQEFITQHPEMSRLHPQSINTIRLLTVRSLKDGQIHVMPSILRVGTGDSIVDNTTQGGLAIGINLDNGYLKQYGFYKPDFGLKVDEHPDSKIRFAEFQIPYFAEVVHQAKYYHSMLPDLHSIGWDIAIGENGPIFIEGNDNWEITGPQTCNGGLRKYFEEYFFA